MYDQQHSVKSQPMSQTPQGEMTHTSKPEVGAEEHDHNNDLRDQLPAYDQYIRSERNCR
jgi:hypothetical protein